MATRNGIYEEQRVFNIEATAVDTTQCSQFVIAAGYFKANIINTNIAGEQHDVKIRSKVVTFLACHPKFTQSVAIISGCDIGLYSLDLMQQQVKWKHANGSSRFVTDVSWSNFESNLLVTCSPYDSTLVRDVRNHKKVAFELGSQSGAIQSKFSPMMDHIIATSNCNQIMLWDLRSPKRSLNMIEAHSCPVTCLKWHPTRKHSFFTSSKDNILRCWDFFNENGEFTNAVDFHERDLEAWRFWFSPDGEEYAIIKSPLNTKAETQLEVYQYPFEENLDPLKVDNSDLFVDVCWSKQSGKPSKFVWALRQSKGLIRHAINYDYSNENREQMPTPIAQSAMDKDADELVSRIQKAEIISPSSSEFGSPEREKGGMMIGEMDMDHQSTENIQKQSISPLQSWNESSMKFSPSGSNLAALVAQAHLSRHGSASISSPTSSLTADYERWITAPSVTGGDLNVEMDALWTVEADGITMTEINIPRAALGFTYEHFTNAKKLGFEIRFHRDFVENGKVNVKLLAKDCPLNSDQARRILQLMQQEADNQVRISRQMPVLARVLMEMRKLVASMNVFSFDGWDEERKRSISSVIADDNESEGSESSLRHSVSLSFVPNQLDELVPAPRTSGAQFDSSGFLVRFGNFRSTNNFGVPRSDSKLSGGLDFKEFGIIEVGENEIENKKMVDHHSSDDDEIQFGKSKSPEDSENDEESFKANYLKRRYALEDLENDEPFEVDGTIEENIEYLQKLAGSETSTDLEENEEELGSDTDLPSDEDLPATASMPELEPPKKKKNKKEKPFFGEFLDSEDSENEKFKRKPIPRTIVLVKCKIENEKKLKKKLAAKENDADEIVIFKQVNIGEPEPVNSLDLIEPEQLVKIQHDILEHPESAKNIAVKLDEEEVRKSESDEDVEIVSENEDSETSEDYTNLETFTQEFHHKEKEDSPDGVIASIISLQEYCQMKLAKARYYEEDDTFWCPNRQIYLDAKKEKIDQALKLEDSSSDDESEYEIPTATKPGKKKQKPLTSVLVDAPKSTLFPFGDKAATPRSFYQYLTMMEPILKDIAEAKRVAFGLGQNDDQINAGGASFSPDPKGDMIPGHCVSPVRNYSLSSSPTTAAIWLQRNNPTARLSSSPNSAKSYSTRLRGGSLTLTDPESNLKSSSSDVLVSTPVELFDVSRHLPISKVLAKNYKFIGESFKKKIKHNRKLAEQEELADTVKTWELCAKYVGLCNNTTLPKRPKRCRSRHCPTDFWGLQEKFEDKEVVAEREKLKFALSTLNRHQPSWNANSVSAQFFSNLLEHHVLQGDVQSIAAITCTLGDALRTKQKSRIPQIFDEFKPQLKLSLENLSRSTSDMNTIPSSPLINVVWPPNFNRAERSASIGSSQLNEQAIAAIRRLKMAQLLGPLAERNTVHGSLMTVDPNEKPKNDDNFELLKKWSMKKPRSNSVEFGDFGMFLAENFGRTGQSPSPPSEVAVPEVKQDDSTMIFDCEDEAATLPLDSRRGTEQEPFMTGKAIDQFENHRVEYAEILARWRMFQKSAEVFKFCPSQDLGPLANIIACEDCQRILDPTEGGFCTSCGEAALSCSVCGMLCYGLFSFCPLCSHGGHPDHVAAWFKEQHNCPFGCGCPCPL